MTETFLMRRSADMLESDPEAAREAFRVQAARDAPLCPSCLKPVKHRKGLEWCQDHEMSEAVLQTRVRQRAKTRGWKVMHVAKAIGAFDANGNEIWLTPADEGWPDLFLMNPRMPEGRRAIAMELKRQDGTVTEAQQAYLLLLNACGIPAVVVRPQDLREGRVNAILEGK